MKSRKLAVLIPFVVAICLTCLTDSVSSQIKVAPIKQIDWDIPAILKRIEALEKENVQLKQSVAALTADNVQFKKDMTAAKFAISILDKSFGKHTHRIEASLSSIQQIQLMADQNKSDVNKQPFLLYLSGAKAKENQFTINTTVPK